MFPSKRPVGGEVLDGGYRTDTDSLLKKQRIDNLIFSSVTATTTGSEKSAGEGDSSSLVGYSKSGSSTDGPSLPDMTSGDEKTQDIDEYLHSRQLAVYGRETMRRIFAANVLISGMQGLGAEIAKNLILAGVKSVALHDEGLVELWDLSSNFIFSEVDVGKNRAIVSIQKLQELNNAVAVSILTTKLTKEQLSDFQAVVFTDINLETAIAFDDYCHNHKPPIAFIKAEVRGLFGNVFCDFGPEFTILDVDGEETHTGIIASISNENPAHVLCIDDERLEFQDGDLVVFSEIRGMTELNDGNPRKIVSATSYSITLDEDTTNFDKYEKGGIVTQVKQPKILNFKPLREALKDPDEFLLSDFSKSDRPPLLHFAFQALDKFLSELGRFPVAGLEGDAQKLISIAGNINESSGGSKLQDIDPIILRHFAFGARAVLNPMAAMFGGIVAQEVMKACSATFHPLFQFFYFDSVESLPTEPLEPSDIVPLNSRYDAQISIFGSKLQKKLEEAQIFVVGSGALGCEFLKNLALMGVSCNNQGKLKVTDDDIIKKNNLSSQFLFRDWNIGEAKSTVAASAASLINPSLRIEALQEHVGRKTENVFNDSFWEKQSVIVNAVDNVEARLYVDKRCLYFQKPLLESGTLGAKCNTQMVIPKLTESYGASKDPPDKEALVGTVQSFPHNIHHCLTWAMGEFDELLEDTPDAVNNYLSNPLKYASVFKNSGDTQVRDHLERVLECLDKYRCKTFQDSISWARLKFQDYFSNRVEELIFKFPEDAATNTCTPFWSAPKRFPKPLQFSATDRSHLQFIMSASILRAETFGVPIPEWAKDPTELAKAVDKVTDDKATSSCVASVGDKEVIKELIKKLEQRRTSLPSDFRMKLVPFEKEDNTNHHMDLIVALANLRARNYAIPEVDKLKAKIIAGKILPAIATSTAMATGLVCLELYKVLDGGHSVEDYRNTFANLALPFFSMAEPLKPKVQKHGDMVWTEWDRWTVEGNPSLGEFLQWFKAKGLNASRIWSGSFLLFSTILPKHADRMDKKVVDLLREVAHVEPLPYRRHFDIVVLCLDDEGGVVDIPEVLVYFR